MCDVRSSGRVSIDLDQCEHKGIWPVERTHHLVVRNGDRSGAGGAALDLNHPQRRPLSTKLIGHHGFNVVAAVICASIPRRKSQLPLDSHDGTHAGKLYLAPACRTGFGGSM